MTVHGARERPATWNSLTNRMKRRWLIPFIAFEWIWDWTAYLLSCWSFLEVLDYLGRFSILVAVVFYFSESGNRIKQRHYQAWQVINTAQGKGGSGGRIEALQELNADKVPLVGVDVSSAFLQGLKLERANLLRADFSAADPAGEQSQKYLLSIRQHDGYRSVGQQPGRGKARRRGRQQRGSAIRRFAGHSVEKAEESDLREHCGR